jgi:predicted MPP superfamily phosphohydrolase
VSVETQIAELRARLSLLQGTPTLLLAVAQSDAAVEETRRVLLAMLRATPLEIADLGPCRIDTGPARWAELTRQHADATAFALTFAPTTTLEAKVFAQRLNAERQWLRELAGPVVFVVSRTTERALRQHAQDFVTWVAHSDEFPAPQELAAVAPRLGVQQEAVTPKLAPEPPIRFLHISDLHLDSSRRYDQDRVLDGLLTFLERDRAGFPLDLVFVTGDLARTGKPAQYELVAALIKELMLRTGVPAERFFVVPGNHDADRDVGRWLLRTLSSDEEATAFFEDARSRQFHAQKLAAYQQSMKALLGATRPLGIGVGEDSVEIVEIRGARIAVAAFNSAWFAQGDDDSERLWVGEANVMRAVDRIADEEALFAIALLHHPFNDLHPLDREMVEPWMERGFDLVLRGHLHANKTRSLATQRGGFVELAAPAAYQGSNWGNGCFLGEIRPRERTVRVRPFMYAAGPDPWVLDTRVFPDDTEDGYCHSFAVPAKARIKSAVGRPLRAATAAAMRSVPAERQREIVQEIAGAGSPTLSGAKVTKFVRSSDEWRGVTRGEDPGIAWINAIAQEGKGTNVSGSRWSSTISRLWRMH